MAEPRIPAKLETSFEVVGDLIARISSIADEFQHRAKSIAVSEARHPGLHDCVRMANSMLSQRAARRQYLPSDLFQEPAWDMMLALFVAHHEGVTLSAKALAISSKAPATTSQRWIDHLRRLKLINRVVDANDRRRADISLSDVGDRAMQSYFAAIAGSISQRDELPDV